MKLITTTFGLLIIFTFSACQDSVIEEKANIPDIEVVENSTNLLNDFDPINQYGNVNAIVEIPSGTIEKWELNKSNGKIERDSIDRKPRTIRYLGYPGNYGMIPKTILSKEKGGDGDPLDILVLGSPVKKGSRLECKIIGVLYLLDRGEKDDKLIAVSTDSPLFEVNEMSELDSNYNGISEIIELWFSNYKGPNKMESRGYGDKNEATKILQSAIEEYKNSNP